MTECFIDSFLNSDVNKNALQNLLKKFIIRKGEFTGDFTTFVNHSQKILPVLKQLCDYQTEPITRVSKVIDVILELLKFFKEHDGESIEKIYNMVIGVAMRHFILAKKVSTPDLMVKCIEIVKNITRDTSLASLYSLPFEKVQIVYSNVMNILDSCDDPKIVEQVLEFLKVVLVAGQHLVIQNMKHLKNLNHICNMMMQHAEANPDTRRHFLEMIVNITDSNPNAWIMNLNTGDSLISILQINKSNASSNDATKVAMHLFQMYIRQWFRQIDLAGKTDAVANCTSFGRLRDQLLRVSKWLSEVYKHDDTIRKRLCYENIELSLVGPYLSLYADFAYIMMRFGLGICWKPDEIWDTDISQNNDTSHWHLLMLRQILASYPEPSLWIITYQQRGGLIENSDYELVYVVSETISTIKKLREFVLRVIDYTKKFEQHLRVAIQSIMLLAHSCASFIKSHETKLEMVEYFLTLQHEWTVTLESLSRMVIINSKEQNQLCCLYMQCVSACLWCDVVDKASFFRFAVSDTTIEIWRKLLTMDPIHLGNPKSTAAFWVLLTRCLWSKERPYLASNDVPFRESISRPLKDRLDEKRIDDMAFFIQAIEEIKSEEVRASVDIDHGIIYHFTVNHGHLQPVSYFAQQRPPFSRNDSFQAVTPCRVIDFKKLSEYVRPETLDTEQFKIFVRESHQKFAIVSFPEDPEMSQKKETITKQMAEVHNIMARKNSKKRIRDQQVFEYEDLSPYLDVYFAYANPSEYTSNILSAQGPDLSFPAFKFVCECLTTWLQKHILDSDEVDEILVKIQDAVSNILGLRTQSERSVGAVVCELLKKYSSKIKCDALSWGRNWSSIVKLLKQNFKMGRLFGKTSRMQIVLIFQDILTCAERTENVDIENRENLSIVLLHLMDACTTDPNLEIRRMASTVLSRNLHLVEAMDRWSYHLGGYYPDSLIGSPPRTDPCIFDDDDDDKRFDLLETQVHFLTSCALHWPAGLPRVLAYICACFSLREESSNEAQVILIGLFRCCLKTISEECNFNTVIEMLYYNLSMMYSEWKSMKIAESMSVLASKLFSPRHEIHNEIQEFFDAYDEAVAVQGTLKCQDPATFWVALDYAITHKELTNNLASQVWGYCDSIRDFAKIQYCLLRSSFCNNETVTTNLCWAAEFLMHLCRAEKAPSSEPFRISVFGLLHDMCKHSIDAETEASVLYAVLISKSCDLLCTVAVGSRLLLLHSILDEKKLRTIKEQILAKRFSCAVVRFIQNFLEKPGDDQIVGIDLVIKCLLMFDGDLEDEDAKKVNYFELLLIQPALFSGILKQAIHKLKHFSVGQLLKHQSIFDVARVLATIQSWATHPYVRDLAMEGLTFVGPVADTKLEQMHELSSVGLLNTVNCLKLGSLHANIVVSMTASYAMLSCDVDTMPSYVKTFRVQRHEHLRQFFHEIQGDGTSLACSDSDDHHLMGFINCLEKVQTTTHIENWLCYIGYELCIQSSKEDVRRCSTICLLDPTLAERFVSVPLSDDFTFANILARKLTTLKFNVKIARCLLRILNRLNQFDEMRFENVDLFKLAVIAHQSGMHSSTVFYLERWARERHADAWADSGKRVYILDNRSQDHSNCEYKFSSLMLESYSHMGANYALNRLGLHRMDMHAFATATMSSFDWGESMLVLDTILDRAISAGENTEYTRTRLACALHKCGTHFLGNLCASRVSDSKLVAAEGLQYQQWLYLLGQDMAAMSQKTEQLALKCLDTTIQGCLLRALLSYHHGNESDLRKYVEMGRKMIRANVGTSSNHEGASRMNRSIQFLYHLAQMEELARLPKDIKTVQSWIKDRDEHLLYRDLAFFQQEEMMRFHRALINCGSSIHQDMDHHWMYRTENLVFSSRLARMHHQTKQARLWLFSSDTNIQKNLPSLVIEKAQVCWDSGEYGMAMSMVDELLHRSDKPNAEAWRIAGQWMAQRGTTDPNSVFEQYFSKCINAPDSTVACNLAVAQFSDQVCQNIMEKAESLSWRNMENIHNRRQAQIDSEDKNSSWKRRLTKYHDSFDKERSKVRENYRVSLQLAIHHYGRVIYQSSSQDFVLPHVFRVTALWLENAFDNEVNIWMRNELFNNVPTRCWLPITYQLVSRLGTNVADIMKTHHVLREVSTSSDAQTETEETNFAAILNEFLSKLCREHPYHVWPKLYMHSEGTHTGKRLERHIQAETLLNEYEESDRSTRDLRAFLKFITSVATKHCRTKEKEATRLDPSVELELKRFVNKRIPLITLSLPVLDTPQEYHQSVPYISSVKPCAYCDDGVTRPIKLCMVTSRGEAHVILVKQDDLRQDYVMQQMFDFVGRFLSQDLESRKKNLRIRTYNVIPLSKESGMLEFLREASSMRSCIEKTSKLAIHVGIKQLRENRAQGADMVKIFKSLLERYPPTLHKFFQNESANPLQWFSRTMTFSKSTAVSSMIGYVMGLGDRHTGNILLNRKTGEVIHIDFGITFEQGTLLEIPECVPFRLTPNMCDAMGVVGAEGAFQACCYDTMRVMRTNQRALLTVCQVLINDPLHAWTPPVKKVNKRQMDVEEKDQVDLMNAHTENADHGTGIGNVQAENALLRIGQKLQGTDSMTTPNSSVESQVARVIQEATRIDNLASMFYGWVAFV